MLWKFSKYPIPGWKFQHFCCCWFSLKHIRRLDLTSHWHLQVKLIGRGPAENLKVFMLTRVSQKGILYHMTTTRVILKMKKLAKQDLMWLCKLTMVSLRQSFWKVQSVFFPRHFGYSIKHKYIFWWSMFTLNRGEGGSTWKISRKTKQKSTCIVNMPKIKNLKPFDFITTLTTKTFLQESDHNVKGDFARMQ